MHAVGEELSQRASDDDREQAVIELREHLLVGRLTLDEFSERVEVAYRARTGAELEPVREGLPETATPPATRRKPTRFTAGIFGHVIRRGRLRLRRWTVAASFFADVDLDLRQAEIDAERSTVTAILGFANIDIYVPEGVHVDVRGLTVLGRRREWGRDTAGLQAPSIDVRIIGVVGTIDVWRVPPQMQGTYGEVIKQLREQQRELPG
jgi:Domain of unknown function (DUF1707)/Cell wall-active antibiotics response 4TMS YvqF